MWNRTALLVLGAGLLLAPGVGLAFDPKGHVVIEALAYQTLIEGGDGQPPRPEVLRDLFNDGALVAPICFGGERHPLEACRAAASENPLLAWPQPLTDRPDQNVGRHFSDPGQCVHFMGLQTDQASDALPGRHVPRGLATSAVARCVDLLGDALRQVVTVGGVGARGSGYGLYELMHAVTDSFSYAHAERLPGSHHLDYLRVWGPIGTLALSGLSDYYADSPLQHDAADERDQAYVRNFATVEGRPCRDLTELPYTVPLACLSDEAELARQALVELLVVVRELREAHRRDPAGSAAEPRKAEAWTRYLGRWFTPVTPCAGAECQARQPTEFVEATGLLLGGGAVFNLTRATFDLTARVRLIEWSQRASPFVFGLDVAAGYRRASGPVGPANLGLVGASLVLGLPFDHRSTLSFHPLGVRGALGGPAGTWEVFTQALMFEFHALENLSISLLGPIEVDWRQVGVSWSFGVVVGYTPSRTRVVGRGVATPPLETGDRPDGAWAPGPLWYGRLKGRERSWHLFVDATPVPGASTPDSPVMGGLAALGVRVLWDRNPWGQRLPTAIGGSLEAGLRSTGAATSYLTLTAAAEVRWYVLPWIGLAVIPVRLEGGPRVRGGALVDAAPGVLGSPGGQFFLRPGSRLGLVLSAGLVELLVQTPTLAWTATPFTTGEILSVSLAFLVSPREE